MSILPNSGGAVQRSIPARILDNRGPEWEYHMYPNAGRPAVNTGSPSVRIIAHAGGLPLFGEG